MLHFYDKCPCSLQEQKQRLEAACALSNAGIPCMVHLEDALAFIHFVPTGLFALNLVVADQDVDRASNIITGALPYDVHTGVIEHYCESILLDPAQTRVYTTSTYLPRSVPAVMDEPMLIIVHPQSRFNFNVADHARSVPLPPFPNSIRFPTLAALIDSLIENYLNPSPVGYAPHKESLDFRVYMSYILLYTLRHQGPAVLPNGDLHPNCVEVMQSLRPENRSYFEDYARLSPRRNEYKYHVKNHKDILRSLGHLERANRPRPLPLPGNPILMLVFL
ncbi:hypothetical protein HYPSUDRAFT_712661 [Hypholoma sublateritium FD-334 SS-4]|uniref:Uncharacterized protein n=1 Tax=Hypholoma sublateritium (strain FD-334 SS-4) TaxID=945553 RepID=A0A0D2MWZ5_HYPSF|nr:hypothetical protein HYPSUDRAFT_712661 [Hypholoma sublateritium FD-334 SS-4]